MNILLYADDIVLLASQETDLQFLLNIVENWCRKWRLEVNLAKTNVMHVRNARRPQSKFMFLFNCRTVNYCKSYKYLGSTLDEFLNFDNTAEIQAEAAGRALGALITKTIKNGGFPFSIYSMLFESTVCSVSDYGAEIWGFESRDAISKLHLRAARCFLGLPKNATSAGVLSEMNWPEPVYRAQVRMVRQYFRIVKMDETRLTKKIHLWDKTFSEVNNIQTWSSEVRDVLLTHNLANYFDPQLNFCSQSIIVKLKESMSVKQSIDLMNICHEKPKLRTFVTFKEFGATPSYITMPMSFIKRKFLALSRLSNLSIRLETGRYERPRLEENQRICQACKNGFSIENEQHIFFQCTVYDELRRSWISKLFIPENFPELQAAEKFKLVFNKPENVKATAQYILDAFNKRSKIVNQ